MKKRVLFLCLCAFVSYSAFSQVTYLADTAFATDIGYDSAEASCGAPHMRYIGWQMGRAQSTWLADVFTVPGDSTWIFDTVIVYGVQKYSNTTSSFLNCNLQIYNGAPGLGGAVIWGDTVTNVLVSTGWTGIYKVDTFSSDGGVLGNYYPVMYLKLYLSSPAILPAGTYWLSWSGAGSLTTIPFSPNKVLPGRVNPPGQMARQLYGGVWKYIDDSGNTVGMNMIIKASAAVAGVPVVNKPAASLYQNTPNPFNAATTISFYMPQAGNAMLAVYNIIGQRVATLTDGSADAGIHNVTFNADELAAGVYYYRLSTDAGVASKEMVIVK